MSALQLIALALCFMWGGGSVLMALLMPWRDFETDDLWLMILLTCVWPIMLVWASIELLLQRRAR